MLSERTTRVLLIDGDAFFASTCIGRLEADGFSVMCDGDATRGFETALRERPDMILLQADSTSLLERLKSAPELSTTPVLVLAESASAQEAERCLRAGAHSYLVKAHLVSDDLTRSVRRVLELN